MAPRRSLSQVGDVLKLSGDTFTIKEQLKQLGARYDGAQKCWFLPAESSNFKKLEFLGFIVPSAGMMKSTDDSLPLPPTSVDDPLSASSSEATYTVSQFSNFVDDVFRKHLSFDFWIVGEISSLKSSNNNVYFELVEPEQDRALQTGRAASFSCCLWAGKIRALGEKLTSFPLAEGIKIKLKVHCDFRREGSRFNLIVDDIDPQFTLGDLALQRQNIVRELKRRGLYERQRQFLRWPAFPLRIALITASGSRALTDFVDELKISGLAFRVTLFDCHMQGERVEGDVTQAFALISGEMSEEFDCVVVTRGGGSRLDLRWFDNLEICKAIAYCPLPVLTAIGHFEDVSIADEVALIAEKTPTGAARFLTQGAVRSFENTLARLERTAQSIQNRLQREKQRVDRTEMALVQAVQRKIERQRSSLAEGLRALKLVERTAAQPLRLGYSRLRNLNGRTLKADDFLTSEFPKKVQLELFSVQQNAQLLLDLEVQHVNPLPIELPQNSGSSASDTPNGKDSRLK